MDFTEHDERLILALETFSESLFSDPDWDTFRRICCELDTDIWHHLEDLFEGILDGLWNEVQIPKPTLWIRVTLTPCHRWHLCNIYCTELNAVIATALLGWSNEVSSSIH